MVARRPSSRPVAASGKVPTQIEAMRVPFAAAARRAWPTAGAQRRPRVLDAGHDDRVRVLEGFQAVRRAQGEAPRAQLGLLGAHTYLVAGPSVGQAGPVEHLDRRREVERDDAVQGDDGDGVHGENIPRCGRC